MSSVSSNTNDESTRAPSNSTITRGHSCFSCYQRKVKCDGKRPCSTCIKGGVRNACRSVPRPSKSASRTRATPAAATNYHYLLTRIKRLEDLLDANGIQAGEARSTTQTPTDREIPATPEIDTLSDDGRMIVQHGKTRYVENALWSDLGIEVNTTVFLFCVWEPISKKNYNGGSIEESKIR